MCALSGRWAHSPGSGPAARLGAVAFIHRFGSTLNAHLHFHCVVIDGVFDAAAAGGVVFHAAGRDDLAARTQPGTRRRTGSSSRRPLHLGAAVGPHLRSLPARVSQLWRRMCIIAFITDGPTVRDILVHLGESITPPTVAPARGPPLWEMPPAGQREIDPEAQPAPSFEFDQRVAW